MSDKDKVIPFGKYKGQPVEVLQGDPAYTDWLTAQPWLRERHAGIYQIIVNNFREPSETPEHNRLQARFLDPAFRQALFELLSFEPKLLDRVKLEAPQFELAGWDVVVAGLAIEIKPSLADDFPAVLRQIKAQLNGRPDIRWGTTFISGGYRPVLVIDRFDAEGATLDQVRQMFGFPIVTIPEIEAAR